MMLAMQQSQGSPLLGPKSMRNVVKVRLPNDQKTAVRGCLLSWWCASVLNAEPTGQVGGSCTTRSYDIYACAVYLVLHPYIQLQCVLTL